MTEWWSAQVFHGGFRASRWEEFRSLPVVRAALDAVPDPVEPGGGQIIDLTRAAAGELVDQAARRFYLSRSA